jgi:hypothetical protein
MTAPTGRVDSTGEVLPALRVEDLSVYFDTENRVRASPSCRAR